MENLKLTNYINQKLIKLGYDEIGFEGGRGWSVDCLKQSELNFGQIILSDSNIEKLIKRFYVGYAREAMMNSLSKLLFSINRNKLSFEEACVEPGLSSYEEVVCNDFICKVNNELKALGCDLVNEGKSLLNIN